MSTSDWDRLKRAWNQLNDEFWLGEAFDAHTTYAQHSMSSDGNVAVPVLAPNGGNLLFLPWHRRLVANLEDELHARDSEVVLPYWAMASHPELPAALVDFLPAIRFRNQSRAAFQPTRGNFSRPPPSQSSLDFALSRRLFSNFTLALESRAVDPDIKQDPGYHDQGHAYVGGTLANLATSNADIVFYLHHAFVDKAWHKWQQTSGTAIVDSAPADTVLVPFHATVGSVQDIAALEHPYEYL